MVQLRCRHCNRLLMKISFGQGEIKCGRCGKLINFNVTTQMLSGFMERLKERDSVVGRKYA